MSPSSRARVSASQRHRRPRQVQVGRSSRRPQVSVPQVSARQGQRPSSQRPSESAPARSARPLSVPRSASLQVSVPKSAQDYAPQVSVPQVSAPVNWQSLKSASHKSAPVKSARRLTASNHSVFLSIHTHPQIIPLSDEFAFNRIFIAPLP